jgi:hypothetical protein
MVFPGWSLRGVTEKKTRQWVSSVGRGCSKCHILVQSYGRDSKETRVTRARRAMDKK